MEIILLEDLLQDFQRVGRVAASSPDKFFGS
jgi:hypothetical protein